jgi:hypothetical protein
MKPARPERSEPTAAHSLQSGGCVHPKTSRRSSGRRPRRRGLRRHLLARRPAAWQLDREAPRLRDTLHKNRFRVPGHALAVEKLAVGISFLLSCRRRMCHDGGAEPVAGSSKSVAAWGSASHRHPRHSGHPLRGGHLL